MEKFTKQNTENSQSSSNMSTKVQIFFNNVAGFVTKKSKFILSDLARQHDIFIFQETNVLADSRHKLYLDWSFANLVTIPLSFCKSSEFARGMILGFNPKSVTCKILELPEVSHEIAAVRVMSKTDNFVLISAYRSPSMSNEKMIDFFNELIESISEFAGKVVLVGDLNICDRPWMRGMSERVFLNEIENTGLTSSISAATRQKNQLDYAFTNFDVSAKILPGLFRSDHNAISISAEFSLDTIKVPTTYVSKSKSLCYKTVQWIMHVACKNLIESDLDTGDLILEYEILMWEIKEYLLHYRKIPEHTRVRNLSRQLSNTLLNNSLDFSEKCELIELNREKECMRRFKKYNTSPRLANSLSAVYGLTPKSKKFLNCNIDPNIFKQKIDKIESENIHENHKTPPVIPYVIKKYEDLDTENILSNLRKKFHDTSFFNKSFWDLILSLMFTSRDRATYSVARVETVVKDSSDLENPDNFRLVWKSASMSEKAYDYCKSMFVNTNVIYNDAYAENRSTIKALATLFDMCIGENEGLVGVDFQVAFDRICRKCCNTSTGVELLNPSIFYDVFTDVGKSDPGISTAGSGAGRATGGPGFNATLFAYLRSIPGAIEFLRNCVFFADDSQRRSQITKNELLKTLEVFENASSIGLKYHKNGKKAPTLLVPTEKLSFYKRKIKHFGLESKFIVTDSVKFLGIMICIKNSRIVGSVISDQFSKMSYMTLEFSRLSKFFYNSQMYQIQDRNNFFSVSSQAIAAFIESKIQYSILFISRDEILKLYSIHRRAICSLLNLNGKSFGFRPISFETHSYSKMSAFEFFSVLCSKTYSKLCAIAGKPTLLQIAMRQACVVVDQHSECDLTKLCIDQVTPRLRPKTTNFTRNIREFHKNCINSKLIWTGKDIKKNQFFKAYRKINSAKSRVFYVKAATSTLALDHLDRRGFETGSSTCRFPDCDQHESLHHLISDHIMKKSDICLKKSTKRNLSMAFKSDKEFCMSNPKRWASSNLSADSCYVFADTFKVIKLNNFVLKPPIQQPEASNQKKITDFFSTKQK